MLTKKQIGKFLDELRKERKAMKKREFKTPQHKLCSELYLDGKIWALNEVLDPSCVTIQNLDMNTYNCALCGRQITKEDYETDLSFCEECNEATLNKDKD